MTALYQLKVTRCVDFAVILACAMGDTALGPLELLTVYRTLLHNMGRSPGVSYVQWGKLAWRLLSFELYTKLYCTKSADLLLSTLCFVSTLQVARFTLCLPNM